MRFCILSALEKVFPDCIPENSGAGLPLTGFENETLSFQLAFRAQKMDWGRKDVSLEIDSPIRNALRVRRVRYVPVTMACYDETDDNYLRKEAGLFPDLLLDMQPHCLHAYANKWTALWVDVNPDRTLAPGRYSISFTLRDAQGEALAAVCQEIEILKGRLPEQTLIQTRWLHYDSLAAYYHAEVFSELHWQLMENLVRRAVQSGVNMILVPAHTPPLDTRVGGERLTVQLVGVTVTDGQYHFDMTNLRRFIAMCKRCGAKYYEVAHLFTQWGAKHAPKIMATVDGEYRRIFGWETDAAGPEYRAFLQAYIPALRAVFEAEGVADQVRWHISDEPHQRHIDSYRAAKAQVEDLLKGCVVTDALSDFDFYQNGLVTRPIVANDAIDPFLEHGVPGLWTYYCCAQHQDVSNAFIAMPSARTRILAAQLFKYNIEGFLHWGFNFYNAQYSDYPINPFETTDADSWVPAGDPFLVYPGANGQPLDSLRLMVLEHAMQDLRAMNHLAALTSREHVTALIEEGLDAPLTFSCYPHDAAYILRLREKINQEIVQHAR